MGRIIKFEDFDMEGEEESTVAHSTAEPETATEDTPDELVDAEPEDLELEEEQLTNKAQGYVSNKIAKLKEEGFPEDQAAAIAFSMARKRGFDVNDNPNEAEIQEQEEPLETSNIEGELSDKEWEYSSENDDRVWTKADFLETAKGNEEYARMLRDRVTWQSPDTLVDEDLRANPPEIKEVGDTYEITHGVDDTDEAETSDYKAPTYAVKPYDKEDEETIKKVNETKPRITSFTDYELDEETDKTKLPDAVADKADRPLDSSYIIDAMTTYAEELKGDVDTEEDLEVAIEMRQVARSMRSQLPSTGDVHIEDAYDILDDQGVEDKEILAKVKEQIKYIWAQV